MKTPRFEPLKFFMKLFMDTWEGPSWAPKRHKQHDIVVLGARKLPRGVGMGGAPREARPKSVPPEVGRAFSIYWPNVLVNSFTATSMILG